MRGASVLLAVTLLVIASVSARSQTIVPYAPAELDDMLGPIALYPDPLLAQILPAATFPDQLEAAEGLAGYQGGLEMVDNQPWDVSVRAVAHYPDVLRMMATNTDWTITIGQAYVNQPEDVMRSIQRLRGRAKLLGYLSSNSYQTITTTNGYISIVPARAQYIYVPTYNPSVVYVQRRPSYGSPWITFGAGLLIGAWLNNTIDWNRNRVYYHGWRGSGWINRSRSHVRVNDRNYVNPGWAKRSAPINRGIRTRDVTKYRQEIKRNTRRYTPPGLVTPDRTRNRPGTPSTRPGTVTPRPATPIPGVTPNRPARPGTGPRVQPGTTKARPNAPVARPSNRVKPRTRPGAVSRPVTPKAPNSSAVKRGSGTRSGVSRPASPTRQNAPRTPGRAKVTKEKKTRGERK